MILRLVVAAILLFVLFKAVSKAVRVFRWYRKAKSAAVRASDDHVRDMVRDPVCGMYISGDRALSLVKDGRRLHFCSNECQEKFLRQQV